MSKRGWSDDLSATVVGPHFPLVKKKTPASGPVAAVYDCRRLVLDLRLWRLSVTAEQIDRIMEERKYFFDRITGLAGWGMMDFELGIAAYPPPQLAAPA